MDANKMTDDYLLEKGYRRYQPVPALDSDIVVARFQKRFDDDFGKKYFIDVIKYSCDYIPAYRRDKYWTPFDYSYEVHTTMTEEENSLRLEFGCSWTLEKVEKFMEDFFNKMKPNYYESWDEERGVRP